MGIAKLGFSGMVLRWANGLRFPYLFLFTAALFVANLFIPDVVPFADELIMGLVAMLLASLKKRKPASGAEDVAENATVPPDSRTRDKP